MLAERMRPVSVNSDDPRKMDEDVASRLPDIAVGPPFQGEPKPGLPQRRCRKLLDDPPAR